MDNMKLNVLIEQVSIKLNENIDDRISFNKWKIEVSTMMNRIIELKMSTLSLEIEKDCFTFDPVDWQSARNVSHEMLDSSLDYIQYVRDRPVYQSIPIDIRIKLENEEIPKESESLLNICNDIRTDVMPYSKGNIHPRYWGWVSGEGTLGGVLSDMIAATLNINTCSGTHSAAIIEKTVIEWMRQVFDFPKNTAGGLLTSGTSMATIISLAAARQRAMINIREDGFIHGHQLVGYASKETHGCVMKAFELLGLGSKALHLISVDEHFSIDISQLKSAIRDDRSKGLIPFCIIGNAGTVNTGAFDNLVELASIAHSENMWFHVDGAFGSFVILDHQRRDLVLGIDQADSLVFDFHKWLHCPFDAGCILVRNISDLEMTFSTNHSYLKKVERGNSMNKHWYYDLGPELSRSFRALKVWFIIRQHGIIKLGQKINENCQQAQYLVSLLEQYQNIIRIVRPVSLNIVNFRFEPEEFNGMSSEIIDIFNEELVLDIQTDGIALPSTTVIENRLYIRVAIVSHRTEKNDFDLFVETLLKFYRKRISI